MNEIPWHDRISTNENTDTAGTDEELYQAFKARLIEELKVDVHGTSHYGRLVELPDDYGR